MTNIYIISVFEFSPIWFLSHFLAVHAKPKNTAEQSPVKVYIKTYRFLYKDVLYKDSIWVKYLFWLTLVHKFYNIAILG